jgi:hypothetical protein
LGFAGINCLQPRFFYQNNCQPFLNQDFFDKLNKISTLHFSFKKKSKGWHRHAESEGGLCLAVALARAKEGFASP